MYGYLMPPKARRNPYARPNTWGILDCKGASRYLLGVARCWALEAGGVGKEDSGEDKTPTTTTGGEGDYFTEKAKADKTDEAALVDEMLAKAKREEEEEEEEEKKRKKKRDTTIAVAGGATVILSIAAFMFYKKGKKQ